MKIGIYSDIHCSRVSSILPLYGDKTYSTRLQMVVDTYKWMYDMFSNIEIDLIVNCGDTFDSNTIHSDELTAISEAYSYSRGIREIIISGNHETLDSNGNFEACNIFRNKGIEVYTKPQRIDDKISVLPYCHPDSITSNLLDSISNDILFSHIDIKGSHLRPDYILPNGADPELLSDYFNVIINGHIHTPEVLEIGYKKVINIGSTTSMSFGDNSEYTPSVCVYDTETKRIDRFNNPHAILFRKIKVDSVRDLQNIFKKEYSGSYKYALRVSCPYSVRDNIKQFLEDSDKVISYRIITDTTGITKIGDYHDVSFNINMKDEFMKFLEAEDSKKYPILEYRKVLENIE